MTTSTYLTGPDKAQGRTAVLIMYFASGKAYEEARETLMVRYHRTGHFSQLGFRDHQHIADGRLIRIHCRPDILEDVQATCEEFGGEVEE